MGLVPPPENTGEGVKRCRTRRPTLSQGRIAAPNVVLPCTCDRTRVISLRPYGESPLSGVDERRGRLSEPLRYSHRQVHVRNASGAQVGQSVCRAVEFLGKPSPGETAFSPLLVERRVELIQIPSEAAVGSCLWQPDIADVDQGTCEEVLRCSAEPPQHEHRVLTGDRTSCPESRNCSSAERMILSLLVENRRLLPEFSCQLVPVQPAEATFEVECREERIAVEDRSRPHAPTVPRSRAERLTTGSSPRDPITCEGARSHERRTSALLRSHR